MQPEWTQHSLSDALRCVAVLALWYLMLGSISEMKKERNHLINDISKGSPIIWGHPTIYGSSYFLSFSLKSSNTQLMKVVWPAVWPTGTLLLPNAARSNILGEDTGIMFVVWKYFTDMISTLFQQVSHETETQQFGYIEEQERLGWI